VFKLSTTEDGVADPKEMKKFAEEWLTYINTVPLTGFDVPLFVPEQRPATTTPGGGPLPPVGPAGGNGRPGGKD